MPAEKKSSAYLSLEEVAAELSIDYQLVYRLVRSGSLPAIKLGRIYRVQREVLEAYLVKHTVGGKSEGFRCGACGRFYHSEMSRSGYCSKTGRGVCLDCWERKGIRECQGHEEDLSH